LFDDRTIAFQGNVNGNELTFTWELQGGNRDTNGPFGTDAPQRFTAKRVPDATDTLADKVNHMRRSPEVSFERIQHADREPQNWLTYSGTNLGHRFSPLTQINPDNVKNLKLEWLWQAQSQEKWEATPLVVDGILYTVQAPNNVVALNAETGQVIWTYPYSPKNFNVCCGSGNRGLAILGNTLFMGTLDAHLLAIDAYTGSLVWDRVVANSADPVCQIRDQCYAIDHAPLVTKDKVIVGTAGGDGRIRGFIAAFDARTGKEIWRFYTIPATGEPGNETWSGDSWKIGGAGVWNTGTYDPDSNLTYWGTGNPNPTDNANSRLGDNLYSDSVVALDADTGKLKWYFQFTAHDDMDWDAAQVPILADIEWRGQPRKVMLWPNRNGFFYVLDRITGKFLQGTPFVERNWASGLDENGRPVGQIQRDRSQGVIQSATNWYPPSYSPVTGLLYVGAEEGNRNPYGAVRALDPQTGEKKWEFRMNAAFFKAGVLTTASNLLFTGVEGQGAAGRLVDGNFYALDARTGSRLWEMALPRSVQSGPMSYAVGGKQYVAVSAGNTLFAFSLRQ
jgi:alcohol dehydrogenase (cytochrome c)